MNNKKRVDGYIPDAIRALSKSGIEKNGKVDSSYRSQVSAFGAAVAMGSFKQAVAFFAQDAKDGKSGINRSRLIIAIDYILSCENDREKAATKTAKKICEEILKMNTNEIRAIESRYLDAAVALKLSMNIFDMDKTEKKEG